MATEVGVVHEIVRLFDDKAMPLSKTLREMLNEHYTHRSERRGCGFTQATRVLSDRINYPRDSDNFDDLSLFANRSVRAARSLRAGSQFYDIEIPTWRNLDLRTDLDDKLALMDAAPVGNNFLELLADEIQFQRNLRAASETMEREESRLLVQMLADIILPRDPDEEGLFQLPVLAERPKVGSCPLAEKFFLEIAESHMPRKGRVNVLVNDLGEPLMLEKLNMGDNHSCVSLVPLLLNGVRLPVGSLLATDHALDPDQYPKGKKLPGSVIPVADFPGFHLLRLTTLAVSPANRPRAFTAHFEQQLNKGLFKPGTAEMRQLLNVAKVQL